MDEAGYGGRAGGLDMLFFLGRGGWIGNKSRDILLWEGLAPYISAYRGSSESTGSSSDIDSLDRRVLKTEPSQVLLYLAQNCSGLRLVGEDGFEEDEEDREEELEDTEDIRVRIQPWSDQGVE